MHVSRAREGGRGSTRRPTSSGSSCRCLLACPCSPRPRAHLSPHTPEVGVYAERAEDCEAEAEGLSASLPLCLSASLPLCLSASLPLCLSASLPLRPLVLLRCGLDMRDFCCEVGAGAGPTSKSGAYCTRRAFKSPHSSTPSNYRYQHPTIPAPSP
jgi:hypothetical protein